MKNKSGSLLFKFAVLFAIFTVVTLVLSGVMTYLNQMKSYTLQCQDNIQNAGHYLVSLIEQEGDDFITYQDFYVKHYKDMQVPIQFDSYNDSQLEYEKRMAEVYPGKVLGEDIELDELDEESQKAYFKYTQQYWQLTFEHAARDFDMPYAYYCTYYPEDGDCMYVIDGERTTPNDHLEEGEEPDPELDKYMYLGDTYKHNPDEHKIEWLTFTTGKEQHQFMTWDNAWGHTYSYYTPLILGEKTMGFVGTEIDVAKVNRGILLNTLEQTVGIGAVLILCVLVMLFYINRQYISKIVRLSDNVRTYSQKKDAAIAREIEEEGDTADEISALANQTAAMVLELENYMKSLLDTTKELSETKRHANDMRMLANKDALTGIRNKTAYDNEVKQLEWSIGDGFKDFGIAMIDLNFLKRINDTFGHEQGNVAIKKLCFIVCHVFEHSPVFRVGGDEFVVILRGSDLKNIDGLVDKFNSTLDDMAKDKSLAQWERVSAAIGVAFFDPARDDSVENVFKRADKNMYARKKEMKAIRSE